MTTHSSDILTPHLRLVASTVELLRIELEAPEKLGAALGVKVPASWPPGFYDRDAIQFFLEKTMQGGAEALGWYGWYAIRRATEGEAALLVAAAGYVGPPSAEGIVEMGYSVAPEERRKGYAQEMVTALIARALQSPNVRHVVAEVNETNEPSVRTLEKCGFVRIGPGRDPGHWRYQYRGTSDRK